MPPCSRPPGESAPSEDSQLQNLSKTACQMQSVSKLDAVRMNHSTSPPPEPSLVMNVPAKICFDDRSVPLVYIDMWVASGQCSPDVVDDFTARPPHSAKTWSTCLSLVMPSAVCKKKMNVRKQSHVGVKICLQLTGFSTLLPLLNVWLWV